ncbi:MAG: carboxypeptidase regulatory-like domain-containing protein [Planctomyces sp.]|nr:carboxypeptidase regulatory-like domain-containing protein [Planctomyces sp.]
MFQISGSVSDQDNAPIEGAEIVLIDETGNFSTDSVYSHADGTFFFEDVCAPNPSGKRPVTIKCSKPGFTSFHSSGELNDVTKDYKIILKRSSPETEH